MTKLGAVAQKQGVKELSARIDDWAHICDTEAENWSDEDEAAAQTIKGILTGYVGTIEKMRHFLQWHVFATGQPNTPATALDDYLAGTQAKLKEPQSQD